jgi:hypothetical protein
LLNECAGQVATRAVGGSSYGPEFPVPPNEPESEEELVLADDEVAQWEDWCDPDRCPRNQCWIGVDG